MIDVCFLVTMVFRFCGLHWKTILTALFSKCQYLQLLEIVTFGFFAYGKIFKFVNGDMKIKCSVSESVCMCVCVYSGVSKTERGGERGKETENSITLQKFKNIF